eukprot:13411665-Heterocapsa_arctica.AAC.1
MTGAGAFVPGSSSSPARFSPARSSGARFSPSAAAGYGWLCQLNATSLSAISEFNRNQSLMARSKQTCMH